MLLNDGHERAAHLLRPEVRDVRQRQILYVVVLRRRVFGDDLRRQHFEIVARFEQHARSDVPDALVAEALARHKVDGRRLRPARVVAEHIDEHDLRYHRWEIVLIDVPQEGADLRLLVRDEELLLVGRRDEADGRDEVVERFLHRMQ